MIALIKQTILKYLRFLNDQICFDLICPYIQLGITQSCVTTNDGHKEHQNSAPFAVRY